MSLLQEALKRKESGNSQPGQNAQTNSAGEPQALAESGERRPLGLARPSGQSAPEQTMPVAERVLDAGAPRPRSKSSVKWIVLILLVLCALVIAMAGAVFFFPQLKTILPGGKSAPAQAQPAPAAAAALTAAVDAAAQAPAVPVASVPATGTVASAETAAAPERIETNAPVQAAGVAAKKPARAAVRTAPQAPRWPELKLSGVLRGSGHKESSAFINGKMYSVGQTVEGVEIVEIQPQGVVLKYSGETRFLRVGALSY